MSGAASLYQPYEQSEREAMSLQCLARFAAQHIPYGVYKAKAQDPHTTLR